MWTIWGRIHRMEREADHLPPLRADVENAWSSNFTQPVFICDVKLRLWLQFITLINKLPGNNIIRKFNTATTKAVRQWTDLEAASLGSHPHNPVSLRYIYQVAFTSLWPSKRPLYKRFLTQQFQIVTECQHQSKTVRHWSNARCSLFGLFVTFGHVDFYSHLA